MGRKGAMHLRAATGRDDSLTNIYEPSRVVIVSDHPVARHGLRQSLERSKALEHAADVDCSSAAGVLSVHEHCAELAIVDIVQPIRKALSCVRRLRTAHPKLRILAIAAQPEWLLGTRAMRAGANGFVCKSESVDEILTACEIVARGQGYISREALRPWTQAHSIRNVSPVERLADSELDVLYYMAGGVSISQIKAKLNLTDKAVRNYKERLLRKLGEDGQVDLGRYAIEQGLIAAI